MPTQFKHIVSIIIPIMLAGILWSCGDKEDPSDHFTYYDVVVYGGNNGAQTSFLTVNPETGSDVMFTSTESLTLENAKTGDCLFIGYTMPDNRAAYTSGNINLLGYSEMTNIKAEVVAHDEIEGWNTTPFYLISYFSMYNRLIIYAGIPYSPVKRKLALKIDQSTLDSDMATAYLYQKLDDSDPTFERCYRMAFNFSEIANQLPGNRLKVMVNNTNLTFDSFEINIDK